mgnify:CR=1 FL=1
MGARRFELRTSSLSGMRSNRLSYAPLVVGVAGAGALPKHWILPCSFSLSNPCRKSVSRLSLCGVVGSRAYDCFLRCEAGRHNAGGTIGITVTFGSCSAPCHAEYLGWFRMCLGRCPGAKRQSENDGWLLAVVVGAWCKRERRGILPPFRIGSELRNTGIL